MAEQNLPPPPPGQLLNQGSGVPQVNPFAPSTNYQPAAWPTSISPKSAPSIEAQNLAANQRVMPEYNPADKRPAYVMGQNDQERPVPYDYHDGVLLTRITNLENNFCAILYSLTNSSITAACNTDNTITITLTLPSLPTYSDTTIC